MLTFIATIHIITCLLLIALVLLQDPKNAGVGSMFGGGGSNSLLGATGATSFLTKLTRYAAIVFGICSIILTLMSRPTTSSIMDQSGAAGATAPMSVPAANAPAQEPAAEGTKAPSTPDSK